jgi:hypothetical protein
MHSPAVSRQQYPHRDKGLFPSTGHQLLPLEWR